VKLDADFYKFLVDGALDDITLIDGEGFILFQTESVEANFGYAANELISTNVFDLLHPADHDKAIESLAATLRGEDPDRLRCRMRHKNEIWRQIEVVGRELAYNGQACVLLHTRDVTEQHRTLTELEESRDAFSAAFNSTTNISTLTDPATGRYIEVNDRFLEATGWTREEVIGRTALDLNIWGSPENRASILAALQQNDGHLTKHHATLSAKDGTSIRIIMNARYLNRESNPCLYISAEDVTENEKIEEQLRQSQKMEAIGQLTAGIAHDFNNMLSVIIGNAELASLDSTPRDRQKTFLDAIVKAASSGSDLIRQLQLFAQNLELNARVIDLGEHISGLEPLLQSTLGKEIVLAIRQPPGPHPIEVDPNQLDVALVNLSINAKHAMPEGGTLTLDLAREEQGGKAWLRLDVIDTGIGMSRETQEQSFNPFFTTRPDAGGSGLGLSMVYGFIMQSGGSIALDSVLGRGTRVSMSFPLVDGEGRAVTLAPVSSATSLFSGRTALVVDDNVEIKEVMSGMLRSLGIEPIEAASAAEALELDPATLDLLVVDVMLPGRVKGPSVVDAMLRRKPDLPVLYISGYQKNVLDISPSADNRVEFLQKPFSKADFCTTVESLMREPTA